MSFQNVKGIGFGGSHLNDGTLEKAVKELQQQQFSVVDGAAADTNIALAGAGVDDTIQAAINLTDLANVSELPAITSAGNIQFPTVSTATKKLLIVWCKK